MKPIELTGYTTKFSNPGWHYRGELFDCAYIYKTRKEALVAYGKGNVIKVKIRVEEMK